MTQKTTHTRSQAAKKGNDLTNPSLYRNGFNRVHGRLVWNALLSEVVSTTLRVRGLTPCCVMALYRNHTSICRHIKVSAERHSRDRLLCASRQQTYSSSAGKHMNQPGLLTPPQHSHCQEPLSVLLGSRNGVFTHFWDARPAVMQAVQG